MSVRITLASLLTTLVVALPLLASPAHAISTYTVVPLGGQLATRVNENGDTVGWGVVNGNPTAFVYTPEQGFQYLPMPTGMTHSLAHDVSDRGATEQIQIVGSAYPIIFDEPGVAYRWTYQPTTGAVSIAELGVIGTDKYSVAQGINSQGQVVGYSDPADLLSGGVNAFIYDDVTGLVSLGFKGQPQEINDNGQIAGFGGTAANAWRVTAGTFEDLGKPLNTNIAWAYAINELGSVAGAAILPTSSQERVVRYTDAAGWEVLGGIGTTNIGWGINDSGDVVGEGVADLNVAALKAVIYADDINRLAYVEEFLDPAFDDWTIFAAYDINNAGQIAAYGVDSAGNGGGLLLQPSAAPLQPPLAPTGLLAATVAGGIELHWTDTSNNELVFRVERRAQGTTDDFLEISTTSAAGYLDTTVANCGRYEYRVRASNSAGNSDYTNIAAADAPCLASPLAPSDLNARLELGLVVLNWIDNSDNETHFEVERDAGQGFVSLAQTDSTGYEDNAAEICSQYDYRVRAVNAAGASDYSNVAQLETDCPPVGSVAPAVTISAPAEGDIISFSDVQIVAQASDDNGIVSAEVFVGANLICSARIKNNQSVLNTVLDCTWKTRKYTAGDYTIEVVAQDIDGNRGLASVNVTLLASGGGGNDGGGKGGGNNGNSGGKPDRTLKTSDVQSLELAEVALTGGDSIDDTSTDTPNNVDEGSTGAGGLYWLLFILAAAGLLRRRRGGCR